MNSPLSADSIRPQQGESYEDYVVRAHLALLDMVPEPAERNAAVWGMWEQTNGDAERQRAAQKFTDDQFVLRPLVPLFIEHDKVNKNADGSEAITHYDVNELTRIIRENNFRIEDTDSYTGLVDRHTVPGGARDPLPPRTLGYVGPYRLGMLGRKHPRFAIFADEHHRKDKADVLADRPRRSVEVLRLKANGRRYIDPIAALAEAPRLPLPTTQYAATDGIVERYSAISPDGQSFGRHYIEHELASHIERFEGAGGGGAGGGMGGGSGLSMAYPGGSNTHVKQFNVQTATPAVDRNGGAGVGNSPETRPDDMGPTNSNPDSLVRQVIDALQSTEEWQAMSELTEMLKSGALGGDAGGAPMGGDMPMGDAVPGDPMAGGGESIPEAYPDSGPQALAGQSAAPMMTPDMPPGGPVGTEAGDMPMPEAAAEDDQILGGDSAPPPDVNAPIAPMLAGAGRAIAGAAKNPAVQQGVGNLAGSAMGSYRSAREASGGSNAGGPGTPLGGILQGLERMGGQGMRGNQAGNAQYGADRNGCGPRDKNMAAGGNSVQPAQPAGQKQMYAGKHQYMSQHRYQASDVEAANSPTSSEETETMSNTHTSPEVEQFSADQWADRYAALESEMDQLRAENAELTQRCQTNENQLNEVLTDQAEAYAAVRHQVAELTQQKVDGERRARLQDLAQRFPVVSLEDECSQMLYSAGNDISDDQFEHHCDTIERYAAQAVVASPMIPIGQDYNAPRANSVEETRYAAQEADAAMELINQSLRRGERMPYDEALAKAKEKLGRAG